MTRGLIFCSSYLFDNNSELQLNQRIADIMPFLRCHFRPLCIADTTGRIRTTADEQVVLRYFNIAFIQDANGVGRMERGASRAVVSPIPSFDIDGATSTVLEIAVREVPAAAVLCTREVVMPSEFSNLVECRAENLKELEEACERMWLGKALAAIESYQS